MNFEAIKPFSSKINYLNNLNSNKQLQNENHPIDYFNDPLSKKLKTELPKQLFPQLTHEQIQMIRNFLEFEVSLTILYKTCTFKLIDLFNYILKKNETKKASSIEIVGGFVRKIIASSAEYCNEILNPLLIEPQKETDARQWFSSKKNLNDIDIRIFLPSHADHSWLKEYVEAVDEFLALKFQTNKETIFDNAYKKRYVPPEYKEQFTTFSMVRFGEMKLPFSDNPVPLEIIFVGQLERFDLFTVDAFQLDISSIFGIEKKLMKLKQSKNDSEICLAHTTTDLWQSGYDWVSKRLQVYNPESVDINGFPQLVSHLTCGWVPTSFQFVKVFIEKFRSEDLINCQKLLEKILDNHHLDNPQAAIFFICNANYLLSKPIPHDICRAMLQKNPQTENNQNCSAWIQRGLENRSPYFYIEAVLGIAFFTALSKIRKNLLFPRICLRKIEQKVCISIKLEDTDDSYLLLSFQLKKFIKRFSLITKENEDFLIELYESAIKQIEGKSEKGSLFAEYKKYFDSEYEYLIEFLKIPLSQKSLFLKLISLDLYCAFYSEEMVTEEIFNGLFGQPFCKENLENGKFLTGLNRCLSTTGDQKAGQKILEEHFHMFDRSDSFVEGLIMKFWKNFIYNPKIAIDKKAEIFKWFEARNILTYWKNSKLFLSTIFTFYKHSHVENKTENKTENNQLLDKIIGLNPKNKKIRKYILNKINANCKTNNNILINNSIINLTSSPYKKFLNSIDYFDNIFYLIESSIAIDQSELTLELLFMGTSKIPTFSSREKQLILPKLENIIKKIIAFFPWTFKKILKNEEVKALSLNVKVLLLELLQSYSPSFPNNHELAWKNFYHDEKISIEDKYKIALLAAKEKILNPETDLYVDVFLRICKRFLEQLETIEKGKKLLQKLIELKPESREIQEVSKNYFCLNSKAKNLTDLNQASINLNAESVKKCLGIECVLEYKITILDNLLSISELDAFYTLFMEIMKVEESFLFYHQLAEIAGKLVRESLQCTPKTVSKSKKQDFQIERTREFEFFLKILTSNECKNLLEEMHFFWASNPEWSVKLLHECKLTHTYLFEKVALGILDSKIDKNRLIKLFVDTGLMKIVQKIPHLWNKYLNVIKTFIGKETTFHELKKIINLLKIDNSIFLEEICFAVYSIPKKEDIKEYWDLFDKVISNLNTEDYQKNAALLCNVMSNVLERDLACKSHTILIQIFKYLNDNNSTISKLLFNEYNEKAQLIFLETLTSGVKTFGFYEESLLLLNKLKMTPVIINSFNTLFDFACSKKVINDYFIEIIDLSDQYFDFIEIQLIINLIKKLGNFLKKRPVKNNNNTTHSLSYKIQEPLCGLLNKIYDRFIDQFSLLFEIVSLISNSTGTNMQKTACKYFEKLLTFSEKDKCKDSLNQFILMLLDAKNDELAINLFNKCSDHKLITIDNQTNISFVKAVHEKHLPSLNENILLAFIESKSNTLAHQVFLNTLLNLAEGILSQSINCLPKDNLVLFDLFWSIGLDDANVPHIKAYLARFFNETIKILTPVVFIKENMELILLILKEYEKIESIGHFYSWQKLVEEYIIACLLKNVEIEQERDLETNLNSCTEINAICLVDGTLKGMIGKFKTYPRTLEKVKEIETMTRAFEHSSIFLTSLVTSVLSRTQNFRVCKFISNCIERLRDIYEMKQRYQVKETNALFITNNKELSFRQFKLGELIETFYKWVSSNVPTSEESPREILRRLICEVDIPGNSFFERFPTLFSLEWLKENMIDLLAQNKPTFKEYYWVFPLAEKLIAILCVIQKNSLNKDFELLGQIYKILLDKIYEVEVFRLEETKITSLYGFFIKIKESSPSKLLIEELHSVFLDDSLREKSLVCFEWFSQMGICIFENWVSKLGFTLEEDLEALGIDVRINYHFQGLSLLYHLQELGVFIGRPEKYYSYLRVIFEAIFSRIDSYIEKYKSKIHSLIFESMYLPILGTIESKTWFGSSIGDQISVKDNLEDEIRKTRKEIFEYWIDELTKVEPKIKMQNDSIRLGVINKNIFQSIVYNCESKNFISKLNRLALKDGIIEEK